MKKYLATITMFMFVLVVGMRQAEALPTIILDDGVTTKTIVDEGLLDIFVGTPGAVLYAGPIGNWYINVEIGQTKPIIGSALHGVIDLSVAATTKNNTVSTLKVWFSDTGFASSSVPTSVDLSTGGTTVGTVTVNGYADTTDVLFGTGTTIGTLGPYGAGAFSGSIIRNVGASPFSLTLLTTITHTTAGTTTLDSNLAVPEPATLLLMGAGLLGLGIFGRKRMKA